MKRLTLIIMAAALLNLVLAGLSRAEIRMLAPAKPPSPAKPPPSPRANLLINGSFEAGPDHWKLEAGSTAIEGWTVVRGSIDRATTQWCKSSDGLFSLDLDGEAAFGGVVQTFATKPGQVYLVTFDMAGNPEGPPDVKTMRVQAAGQSADFSFKISGRNRGRRPYNLGWQSHAWRFTANNTKTTLEFFSLGTVGGHHGPMLDKVSVLPDTFSNTAPGGLATVLTRHSERIIANVINIKGGKLTLTGPQFKGEVRILVSALNRVSPINQTIKSDGPDRVQLTNGDYLGGKITAITEDSVKLDHQAAGLMSVPRKMVSVMRFSGKRAKKVDKAQPESHIIRFANNDMVSATSVSVADGVLIAQTVYGQLRCPIGKVAHLVLANKGQEQPRRRAGDVTIQTAGSKFTIQFVELSGKSLTGQADHLGSVTVKRGAIKEVVFNIHTK